MRISTFFTVLLLFFFGSASAALAHDVLVDQVPNDKAVLETAPEQITLTFNNSLIDIGEGATVMNVLDSAGNLVVGDAPTITGMDAVQEMPELEDGAYHLVWRVVSSDGHPISGTSTFAIGADGAAMLEQLPALEDLNVANVAEDAEDADSAESTVDAEDESGLPLPAVIALLVAGAGVLITVIVLMVRKSK
ncbi:MAG TPA: copper resistance CopC family protein [Microbacteriaceae bacterium]|nr:copper resistance CopC family protein [Microbacteriaceae bacterium]